MTLVEILVALSLLAAVITGTTGIFLVGLRQTASARDRSQASEWAQGYMEYLRNQSFANLLALGLGGSFPYTVGETGTRTVTSCTPDANQPEPRMPSRFCAGRGVARGTVRQVDGSSNALALELRVQIFKRSADASPLLTASTYVFRKN